MIRSSVRCAGVALLLTMNGCGSLGLSDIGIGARTPSLNAAEAALQGGSGQLALQVSEGVLRESPGNTQAMEIKADALALLGSHDQATVIYQTLLTKNPNSVRATIGLGRIALSKQPAVAETLFQQVLKHDPRDLTALNNVGIARDLQGHHGEAQTAYRQALAINPDLDSAQANLALSMAMSGQGAAAVQLLKAKATQPGVSAKVKHDYAVVLAMAGNRSEAERILREDLSPDDARQVLDGATGTNTRTARGDAPEPSRASVASRDWDDVPPDVVQDADVSARPLTPARTAQSVAPPISAPPAAPAVMSATMAVPAPMIVRPQQASGSDPDASLAQPVHPVAAAITNHQALALPLQATAANAGLSGRAPPVDAVPDQAIVVPEVVAIPFSTTAMTRPAARETANSGRIALAEAPPSSPAAPLSQANQPVKASVRIERTAVPLGSSEGARAASVRSETDGPDRPIARTAATAYVTAAAAVPILPEAAPKSATPASTSDGTDSALRARPSWADESTVMVQFAATPSEQSARAFWQALSHRFPEVLGSRQPIVIRFEHDGTVFWRVRAEGFADLGEAQNLCAQMRTSGQACFVPRS